MPTTTSVSAPVREAGRGCTTRQRRLLRAAALYVLVIAAGIALGLWAFSHFKPVYFTHPDFDAGAVSGTPGVDEERYGYTPLVIDDGYTVYLCGLPACDGESISFYLTNPAENTVWLRAEVKNAAGELLGSTGVLKQGQYLPSITLDTPITDPETQVSIHVVAYEPNTWASRGNVTLKVTVTPGQN